MGVENRDWFWEDRKRREQEFGGDFSLHSKKTQMHPSKQVNKKVSYKIDRGEENTVSNVVTIAIGFILYHLLKSGLFAQWFFNDDGAIGSHLLRVLISGCCFALGILLFASAAKRRKGSDKGLLNVLAMVVSMLIFTFMAVLLIGSLGIFVTQVF